jgi:hypothetical protein
MPKYPFFTIDKSNFVSNPRREGEMYRYTSSPSNKGVEQNCLTLWATKFWPIALWRFLAVYLYGSEPRLAPVSRFGRQLGKEGI